MEATVSGRNRTGAASSAAGTKAMVEASEELTPPSAIDLADSKAARMLYIRESEAVGSIPPPMTLGGAVRTGAAILSGNQPTLLLDKMGERLAYERSGTRLYDALITKYEAAVAADTELAPVSELRNVDESEMLGDLDGETPPQTLQRIRDEEHAHFRMLSEAIRALGGDPTAQTPCADVTATASLGFVQVLTDPRTTLAQCLNTMLAVELADNAGWELLIQLADENGEADLAGQFMAALGQEQQHVAIVRAWLETLLSNGNGTPAV